MAGKGTKGPFPVIVVVKNEVHFTTKKGKATGTIHVQLEVPGREPIAIELEGGKQKRWSGTPPFEIKISPMKGNAGVDKHGIRIKKIGEGNRLYTVTHLQNGKLQVKSEVYYAADADFAKKAVGTAKPK